MLKRAGISDFSPHDCRHTWATWHYAANHDFGQLAELGGWKSAQMVMRYAHINTAHLADSIGRIWGVTGRPSPDSTGEVSGEKG
jgi:integrase